MKTKEHNDPKHNGHVETWTCGIYWGTHIRGHSVHISNDAPAQQGRLAKVKFVLASRCRLALGSHNANSA